ncbi:MAG TPA: tetratricopeptide repeat protein [Balneolaceae bacterium]|nr:tetratricopeptide repeat protein [Balneolaceae bacterium]
MKKLILLGAFVFLSASAIYAQNNSGSDSLKVKPPSGMNQKSAYYLFYSDFQNNNYTDALHYGRWILKDWPRKIKGYSAFDLPTNIQRFITIYDSLASKASDPSTKSAFIDTVNNIYNKAFKKFSKNDIDRYQWYLNRGLFYHKYGDYIDSAQTKEAEQYMKAYQLKPDSVAQSANGYYIRVLLNNLVGKGTKSSKKKALAIINKVGDNASPKLSKYFDQLRNQLYNTPKQRIAYYKRKLKQNPKDEKTLKKLRDLYKQQGNTTQAEKINEKLYKINPSYQNATALANYAIQNGNYQQAINYLNKAKSKTNDSSKLKSIYYNLAKAYMNQDKLKTARNYARKAIHADPKWGQPYILMADIYANTVQSCTSGRNLKKSDKAVYWLVVDYLNKAKRVDPSVRSDADNQLQTYKQYTPSQQDIFFKSDWSKGKKIKINGSLSPCYSWIDETTTVRAH